MPAASWPEATPAGNRHGSSRLAGTGGGTPADGPPGSFRLGGGRPRGGSAALMSRICWASCRRTNLSIALHVSVLVDRSFPRVRKCLVRSQCTCNKSFDFATPATRVNPSRNSGKVICPLPSISKTSNKCWASRTGIDNSVSLATKLSSCIAAMNSSLSTVSELSESVHKNKSANVATIRWCFSSFSFTFSNSSWYVIFSR
mmetsp:Transcript_48216/g.104903  ORF Transcript_48216/g.104903 Transcript_48216/m.104903 type:complete len:201 (-) Transcript_48216:123-725(-)